MKLKIQSTVKTELFTGFFLNFGQIGVFVEKKQCQNESF